MTAVDAPNAAITFVPLGYWNKAFFFISKTHFRLSLAGSLGGQIAPKCGRDDKSCQDANAMESLKLVGW
jgi:hypothetical protein